MKVSLQVHGKSQPYTLEHLTESYDLMIAGEGSIKLAKQFNIVTGSQFFNIFVYQVKTVPTYVYLPIYKC